MRVPMARVSSGQPTVNSDATVLARLTISEQARTLFRPGMRRREYVDCLLQAGLLDDAAAFFGSLVACHAVWWACLSVWKLVGAGLSPAQRDALRVAVRWSTNPS